MDPLEEEILELEKKQIETNHRLQTLKDISSKRKRCENVVDEAICYLHYKPLEDVLSIFPAVKSMKEFWIELLRSQGELPLIPGLPSIFWKHAPVDIRKDQELRAPIIKYGFEPPNVRRNFKKSKTLTAAILETRPTLLGDVYFGQKYLQPHYATLVASTLRRLPRTKHTIEYLNKIASENMLNFVGSNPEVALAWASVGGIYSEQHFSNDIKKDHTIMFAFIQNNFDTSTISKTISLSKDLKRSKLFMLKAIKENFEYMNQVHHSLDGDEDLLLAALSSPGSCFMYELNIIPYSWHSRIIPAEQN